MPSTKEKLKLYIYISPKYIKDIFISSALWLEKLYDIDAAKIMGFTKKNDKNKNS